MKFYGQFEPPVDKFIFERYFPELGIEGVFVECGAFDGLTECSCKFFEETMGWKAFNIEPLPWMYEKLCENRPDSTNINAGLSDKLGTGTFRSVEHPTFGKECTNGSLTHSDTHLESLKEMGCSFKDVEVNLLTWKEFIKQNKIDYIDLFVLDVEGHELQVIEGMKGADVLPDIMCVEYGHLGLGSVRKALDELGYTYDITNNANAYFIKRGKESLFAARRMNALGAKVAKNSVSVTSAKAGSADGTLQQEIDELRSALKSAMNENEHLQQHLGALTDMYNNVINSASWKMAGKIKKLLGKN